MRGKRLESAYEHACGDCKAKVTEKGIQCDGCDLWFHTDCVKITEVQRAVLDEVKKSLWCCSNCLEKVSSFLKSGVHNIKHDFEQSKKLIVETQQLKKDINELKKNLTENTKVMNKSLELLDNVHEIKNEVSKINTTVIPLLKSVEMNTSTMNTKTFADAAKTTESKLLSPTEPETAPRPKSTRKTDSSNILIIENVTKKESVKSSSCIKKEVSKSFPRIKIEQELALANGNVFLHLTEASVVTELLTNWDSNCFGNATKASRPKQAAQRLVIKDFDTELTGQEANEDLKNEYPDAELKCFTRRDGTRLSTATIEFSNEQSHSTALREGIFIRNQHYRTFPYLENQR